MDPTWYVLGAMFAIGSIWIIADKRHAFRSPIMIGDTRTVMAAPTHHKRAAGRKGKRKPAMLAMPKSLATETPPTPAPAPTGFTAKTIRPSIPHMQFLKMEDLADVVKNFDDKDGTRQDIAYLASYDPKGGKGKP